MTYEREPDLAGLRSHLGRELAEEAAEDERLTAVYDRRRFDLAMVAKDLVNRGARVTVQFSGHTMSGLVTGGGADHMVIEGAGQTATVRLDAGYWSILPGAGEPTGAVATEETMTARLAEAAEQGGMVRLALPNGEVVIGRVSVVAKDHIELVDADERRLYVPTGLVLGILRSSLR